MLLAGACDRSGPGTQTPGADAPPDEPPHRRYTADGLVDTGEHSEPAPDPQAGSEVSLDGILTYADQHSPVLAVARSTRSVASAERVAAGVALPSNPELTVSVGPRLGVGGVGVDVEMALWQELQVAGERSTRIDAAERLRDLTDAEIEQIRWSVHCDVHAAFHLALIEQERVALAKQVASFQQDVLRIVEKQVAVGETASLALRLAQAEVAQAEQVVVAAEQSFMTARIRLAQLSGWPVATPPLPRGGIDEPRDPPSLDELIAVAREYQPNLQVGEARIEAAEARTKVAKREVWPRPSIGFQYRREGNAGVEGAYNIVLGSVSLPIPSFQLNQGARARAQADVTVAETQLDASHRLLDGQIAQSRNEVIAAARRTRAYGTEILPRFEENLALLSRSFELGEIDIVALLTARERFLRIQSDALLAQQDYFVALAGLERVVGAELWTDEHGEDTP